MHNRAFMICTTMGDSVPLYSKFFLDWMPCKCWPRPIVVFIGITPESCVR